MIRIQHASVHFEGQSILSDFDLHVPEGKHYALTGPSGTGKTTIFRLIMGFLYDWSGEISVDGDRLSAESVSRIRSKTCWAPQASAPGSGNVTDWMETIFRFENNRDLAHDRELVVSHFKRLLLPPEILTRNLAELSGGQRQRLGLVLCGLLQRPVWLLDEPTSALDTKSKQKAMKYIQEGEHTILSISHDRSWLNMADEVIRV